MLSPKDTCQIYFHLYLLVQQLYVEKQAHVFFVTRLFFFFSIMCCFSLKTQHDFFINCAFSAFNLVALLQIPKSQQSNRTEKLLPVHCMKYSLSTNPQTSVLFLNSIFPPILNFSLAPKLLFCTVWLLFLLCSSLTLRYLRLLRTLSNLLCTSGGMDEC